MSWESEFRNRMRTFGASQPTSGRSVSLKVRVSAGCFHREHSPQAYALIDQQLANVTRDGSSFEYLEHESGPELLVVISAGASLAASVINLLVAILQARGKGIDRGDQPSEPVELIARTVDDVDGVREELILRIGHREPVDRATVAELVDAAVARLANDPDDAS